MVHEGIKGEKPPHRLFYLSVDMVCSISGFAIFFADPGKRATNNIFKLC